MPEAMRLREASCGAAAPTESNVLDAATVLEWGIEFDRRAAEKKAAGTRSANDQNIPSALSAAMARGEGSAPTAQTNPPADYAEARAIAARIPAVLSRPTEPSDDETLAISGRCAVRLPDPVRTASEDPPSNPLPPRVPPREPERAEAPENGATLVTRVGLPIPARVPVVVVLAAMACIALGVAALTGKSIQPHKRMPGSDGTLTVPSTALAPPDLASAHETPAGDARAHGGTPLDVEPSATFPYAASLRGPTQRHEHGPNDFPPASRTMPRERVEPPAPASSEPARATTPPSPFEGKPIF